MYPTGNGLSGMGSLGLNDVQNARLATMHPPDTTAMYDQYGGMGIRVDGSLIPASQFNLPPQNGILYNAAWRAGATSPDFVHILDENDTPGSKYPTVRVTLASIAAGTSQGAIGTAGGGIQPLDMSPAGRAAAEAAAEAIRRAANTPPPPTAPSVPSSSGVPTPIVPPPSSPPPLPTLSEEPPEPDQPAGVVPFTGQPAIDYVPGYVPGADGDYFGDIGGNGPQGGGGAQPTGGGDTGALLMKLGIGAAVLWGVSKLLK